MLFAASARTTGFMAVAVAWMMMARVNAELGKEAWHGEGVDYAVLVKGLMVAEACL